MNSKLKQLVSLFPLKGQVTKEIIDTSLLWIAEQCIGATTLKQSIEKANLGLDAPPETLHVLWSVVSGQVWLGNQRIDIKTHPLVNMMSIIKPQEVTFEIVKIW